jgi:hypothetical protein
MKNWIITINGKNYESDEPTTFPDEAIRDVLEQIEMGRNYDELDSSYEKLNKSITEVNDYDGTATCIDGSEYKFTCRTRVVVEAEFDIDNMNVEEELDPVALEQKKLLKASKHPDQTYILDLK